MLQPLYDKVLLDLEDPSLNSPDDLSVIVLQDTSLPRKARVVATGNGRPTENGFADLYCKEGDIVLIPNFGGITVFEGDKKYTLIRESDILCVVK